MSAAATFWGTGEQKYLESAVDTGFVDNILPPGRPQGIAGPAFASTAFRAGVPDLTCELCACRQPHPRSSSSMSVLGDDVAEAVSPPYVQAGDLPRFERFGHWA
ncbi:ester cyclase [Streptacidiphilus neutrinimicus]|uniref:ester cyclase n=1 Tax=Streptacidiphilus neutrinimicus TaxID=105420 RepID=UPI0005AA1B3D|nr:ester cyclase [Streptacidiphilus neutrinimicus]